MNYEKYCPIPSYSKTKNLAGLFSRGDDKLINKELIY